MIHATRIEAENRERDPSPALTLGEEPCEHCVNDGEHDHRTEESKHVGETNGAVNDMMLEALAIEVAFLAIFNA